MNLNHFICVTGGNDIAFVCVSNLQHAHMNTILFVSEFPEIIVALEMRERELTQELFHVDAL